jgi:O-antigen ligase
MSFFRFEIKALKVSTETIFVLYFWGFMLLRPFLHFFLPLSTVILFLYTLILIILSVNGKKKFTINRNLFFIVSVILAIFAIDLVFRRSNYTFQYLYTFLIYGIIPFYFLSQIENPKKLLSSFSKISIFAFLLLAWVPIFSDLGFFADYMDYGFNLILPSYLGIHLGRKVFKKNWLLPIELLCVVAALFFSNRSVILNIALFYVVLHFFLKPTINGKLLFIIILTLIIVLISFFIDEFVFKAKEILESMGYHSYSMSRLAKYFSSNNSMSFFGGRIEIWMYAQSMIKDNILIGSGTGIFQTEFGKYPHNLYFDIMTQYGVIGMLFYLILISISLIKLFAQSNYIKLVGITFLCMWFPKLFLSSYIYGDIGFWCFIAFAYLNLNNSEILKY